MREKPNMMTLYPESDWMRWLFKAPILSWRLGLGPLVGKVAMILTTTGRKTGLPRHTMVECHTINGKKYAPCAYGEKADYYQNLLVDPRVTVQTADGTQSMIASRVTDDEELTFFFQHGMDYVPGMLTWYLESLGIVPSVEEVLANKEKIYWLRFDPTEELTPPGLEVDLAWLWPLALILVLLAWCSERRQNKK
ncbi:MAG: nitroreductase family deazaflavin-dependent oxidoreductase [Anaerolineaceae bacterium]|nr:nitroreductase family deazaflavin-dependent oxidoreductase [Anaerolineaceae bacterium]